MNENLNRTASLLAQVQQLEHERDELRKDIEQLCMQQAGPSYLAVATKMHFQRTAGLEQEIEKLKKKLAVCNRENLNLQEELSEAYRVKSQLAELHSVEVAKNKEAEKQVKFFHGCVAAAFAERDQSIMEAEKAKEEEELMSQKFNDFQKRLEELTLDCLEQKKHNDVLRNDLSKEEGQNQIFKKVIDKFYEIRQHSLEGFENMSWDHKCECLLHDPSEMWSFNDTSTSKYISVLEEELETLRNSVDNLQNKLRVGLEIENHLKRRVRELEKDKLQSDKMIKNKIAALRHYHSQHRAHIMNLLDGEKSRFKSVICLVEEKVRCFDTSTETLEPSDPKRSLKLEEFQCPDVHICTDAEPNLISEKSGPGLTESVADGKGDASAVLAQALQEKVATLLLLSQQDERHLLERNVNVALQKKIEELQRNLLQVTNEKVKALMEFAQLKQEYQLLQEKIGCGNKQGTILADIGERRLVTNDRDGRLRNLLKKTYLKRWIGTVDFSGNEYDINSEGNHTNRRSNHDLDVARMKIEIATLKESLESVQHLTSSIHRLRLSLLQAKESVTSEGTVASKSKDLDEIINDAILLRTALGSSLPISWSGELDLSSFGDSVSNEVGDIYGDSSGEKIDSVTAAGFEMVDLLILAVQILKDSNTITSGS